MSIPVSCPNCGARFNAPDTAAGRKGKCGRCGVIVDIPAAAPAAPPPPDLPPVAPPQVVRAEPDKPQRGFWEDAMLSFAVPFRGSGPFVLLILVALNAVHAFLSLAGFIGYAGRLIITGWLFSFYFSIILNTAGGEDDLPRFDMTGGPWESIIRPMLLYFGALVWVMLPLILWSAAIWFGGTIISRRADVVVVLVLALIGLFLWPMTVLTVAIRGFSLEALRYDKQLLAIVRAFPQYMAVWLFLLVSVGGAIATMFATSFIAAPSGEEGFFLGTAVIVIATAVISAYFIIVAMRTIGLFYRHYKRHFAWIAE